MTQQEIYNEVAILTRKEKIMDKHYGYPIPDDEYIFTDSQHTDVWEYIRDGLTTQEILSIIRQW